MTLTTRRLNADDPGDLARAADLLRKGGLVAFPTETVYGLAANAFDPEAVARIFAAKGRPGWDPLIVHLATGEDLWRVAIAGPDLTLRVQALAAAFWPGPLTMLLPRAGEIPDAVTAGRERVGVRVPLHPVARTLIGLAGVPLAAPSANRFGHTSPTTAAHVLADLDGRIDAVLDSGPARIGVESTVLDVVEQPMRVYRPGAVTVEQIRTVAGPTVIYPEDLVGNDGELMPEPSRREGLPSPGVGLRHYAPRASLRLVSDGRELLLACMERAGKGSVGVLLPEGWDPGGAADVFPWGPWDRPEVLAQRLFTGLRALDQAGVSTIVCPFPEAGDGLRSALRDRLRKAAMHD